MSRRLSIRNTLKHPLVLWPVGHRADLGLWVMRVAHSCLFDNTDQTIRKVVDDVTVHQKPRAGDATLTTCRKNPGGDAVHRKIKISVRQYYLRRFATQFHDDRLHLTCRHGSRGPATCSPAGKRHQPHIRMINQWLTGSSAKPGDHIKHTRRQIRLQQNVHQL